MKVAIIGAGYVGLVSGACLAESGHDVVCVDLDPGRVASINGGHAPFHEPGLDALLERHAGRGLTATSDIAEAVTGSRLTIIAVGTPFDGTRIDLGQVRAAVRAVGEALRGATEYHAVIVKSTVVPGTTEDVVAPILEESSGRRIGGDLGLGMNPEFLTEGEAVRDFLRPDRIVLGGVDERSISVQEELYGAFPDVPVIRTNPRTAEMIKYTSNALLATLISFSNEIGNLGVALGGIDVADVMRGVHASRYLTSYADGERGAIAPIASFLWAGCGFGGSCLPKDVSALAAQGRSVGQPMPILESVLEVNRAQPERMIELIRRRHPSLRGLRVTVLGLAFRPDTSDMRESPAIPIVRTLVAEGAEVVAYDPQAIDEARRILADLPIRYAGSMAEAVAGAEAVLLVTRWTEFRDLPAILRERNPDALVVDGRRILDPGDVRAYEGIGR